ncbi:hypothetical protein [Wolbachia endosymbiont (group E) of Neria commutata]|uniref:hypothetical protein n=1 Tax=Wolbachia endosymbiont (group E) of Neria commutata TaxID=3066149 RepID=UPI003132A1EC
MTGDFIKALVNAINLSNYYSDRVSTNFTVKNGQIVCSFDENPDIESYIQEVKSEMIGLFLGNEKLASRLFDLGSFPFSSGGASYIHDKDGRVKALKFDVTPRVEQNCKLLFAMAFIKSVNNEMRGKFEKNPKATENQKDAVYAFVQSITVGRVGGPINDLYSIGLVGDESADPLMSRALKTIYLEILETELGNCDLDSSEFFELNDNVLSIKDVTEVRVVNKIAKHTAERVTLNFTQQGDGNSKVKNITDVFRREVFQLTTVNGKNGILIDGYDSDVFIDKDTRDAGNDFALILKIEVSDIEVRDIAREEADRINAAFRKKGFDDILFDVRGKTEKTQFTKSQEPVYGISNKQFALLIPELMQLPIAYNEASKCFEYAISLGNLCKSRKHYDLKNDLHRILLPKFYKDGYLDKETLLEANNYMLQCLLKSGFGLDGYDKPELVEFVNKKIKELLSANRAIPQATNSSSSLGVSRAMGGSRGSLSSSNSDSSSRSVSPMPRNHSDSSLSSGLPSMPFFGANCVDDLATPATSASVAHKRSGVIPPLDEMSGEYGKCSSVEVVSKDPSSQRKSHGSLNEKSVKPNSKTTEPKVTKQKEKGCTIS